MHGHLDEVGRGSVRGWALRPATPRQRLLLDLFIDGHFAGQVLANQFRSDLRDAGIGDGYHGFELRHPGLVEANAAQRVTVEIPRIGFWGKGRMPASGTMGERVFANASDYLQSLLRRLPVASCSYEDLVPPCSSTVYSKLLLPNDQNPGELCRGMAISAYQYYVLHRFRMESDFDAGLSLGEYRRFLRWYLHHYGTVRKNFRIPLSSGDVAFLNRETGMMPNRIEVMALFADHFASQSGFEEAEWGLYNARALGLADCLVNWSFSMPTVAVGADDFQGLVDLFAHRHPLLQDLDRSRADVAAGLGRVVRQICLPHAVTERPHIEAAYLPVSKGSEVDVQIIGPFSKSLGVGESCRRLAKALQRTKFSLRFCDFTIDYPNEGQAELPFLLEAPGLAKINIIHLNLEEIPKLVAYWPDVLSGATNIAVPYLELSGLAPEQQLGLSIVDRVFAATQHIKTVIGSAVPVDVIGSAIEPAPQIDDRQAARKALLGSQCASSDFVVLVAGDALSGLDRKNLVGAVRAFLMAFPDEADRKLVIKTHSVQRTQNARQLRIWDDIREIAESDGRIILMDRHLKTDEYRALQAACDVYLSLHRAEGLGYHVLECMQLGIPCIVTDYSGTRDFARPDTALRVGYRMVPVQVWQYPFTRGEMVWADPIITEAAEHLRRLATDCQLAQGLSRRGKILVDTEFSLEALAGRLVDLLEPLLEEAPSSC